jgi:amino acid permease
MCTCACACVLLRAILMFSLKSNQKQSDKVEGNILNNLTGADPFVVSAMVAIGIAICLAYPLNVFPARFSVEVGFWPKAKPSLVRHVLLTIVLVFGALGLAIAVPDVDVVFSVIGSTACAYVSFVLPSMLYLKVRYQQEEKKRRALFTNPHQNQARITLGDDNADDFQHSELSVSLCRFFLNPRQLLAVFTIFVGLSVAVVGTTLTVIEVINGDS